MIPELFVRSASRDVVLSIPRKMLEGSDKLVSGRVRSFIV